MRRNHLQKRDRAVLCAQNAASDAGGIATCTRLTALALKRLFKEVIVLASQDFEPATIEDITSIPFGHNRIRFVASAIREALRSDFVMFDFAGTARIHSLLGSFGPPTGVWAHGWEVWRENIRQEHIRALRNMSVVFSNSHHTKRAVLRNVPGLSELRTCWLGTEDERVNASNIPIRSTGTDVSKTMLFIGRNDELFAKGQDILIDIWPRVVDVEPRAQLEFIGGGCNLSRLQKLVAESPVRQSFHVWGRLDDKAVFEKLAAARALIHLSKVEGFGLVTVEATRSRKPVIVSTDDASCEIVQDGQTGFAVPREDKDAIVSAIRRILTNQTLYEQMSDRAYDRCRGEFSQNAFIARFGRQFEAALSAPDAVSAI